MDTESSGCDSCHLSGVRYSGGCLLYTSEMLKELQAQAKKNGAIKVGVVIFNKEAHKSDFMDLETQYDAIAAAIRENISSGTNLSAGILAGKKMLDEDTQVAAGRKSLVLLSDGITYIFGEKPTAVAWGFKNPVIRSRPGMF